MIEAAQKKYDLDEILLILARANVDKGVFGLSLADRLLMLKEYTVNREDFLLPLAATVNSLRRLKR